MNRFDLEQQILGCWNVVEDLKLVAANTELMSPEEAAKVWEGMAALYQLKFQECFDTFERYVENREV